MINDLVMGPGWNPGVLAQYFFHRIQEWVGVESVPPPLHFSPQLVGKFFEGGDDVFMVVLAPSLIAVRGL